MTAVAWPSHGTFGQGRAGDNVSDACAAEGALRPARFHQTGVL